MKSGVMVALALAQSLSLKARNGALAASATALGESAVAGAMSSSCAGVRTPGSWTERSGVRRWFHQTRGEGATMSGRAAPTFIGDPAASSRAYLQTAPRADSRHTPI